MLVPFVKVGDVQTTQKNVIFPLKQLMFEDFYVNVPNKYELYSRDRWGDFPPPTLPKNQQKQHEGKITFGVPRWMRELYPNLYK